MLGFGRLSGVRKSHCNEQWSHCASAPLSRRSKVQTRRENASHRGTDSKRLNDQYMITTLSHVNFMTSPDHEIQTVPSSDRQLAAVAERRQRSRDLSALRRIGKTVLGILHGQHPEPEYARARTSSPSRNFPIGARSGSSTLEQVQPIHVAGYIEKLGADPFEADCQAAPGRDPDALRLAGYRPSDPD